MRFRAALLDLGDTIFGLGAIDRNWIRDQFAAVLAEEVGAGAVEAELEATHVLDALGRDQRDGYAAGVVAEARIAIAAAPHLRRFGRAAERLAVRLDSLCGAADVARFQPADGCATRVQGLKDAGLTLAIVSNTTTSPAVLTAYLERLGIARLIGVIVYSVEVGVRKPDGAIYRIALEGVGVDARDAVFVGDRVREDVVGPRAIGLEAVLTHEFRQEPPGESAPLAVLRSLADLPAVLG